MKSYHYFLFGVVLAAVATALLGSRMFTRPYQYQGSLIDPPMSVGDFELVDQYGQPFRLSQLIQDQEVRAVLVFFGYTYCPDVCPITLAEFKQIKAQLGERAEHLRFVFITVDPERDDPQRLLRHLEIYDPSFIGLTGDRSDLELVWNLFGVYQAKQETGSAAGYLVDHTSRVYVLDQEGNLGLTFGFGSGADLMVQDLSQLIR
jgi:protein SCO1